MHSETDIPKYLCVERWEFPLKASNKRVNVCTYQDRIRVDVREFNNDRATIKCLYFTSRGFISFNGALPFVRHEVLRQMEILQNASNSNCQHIEFPSFVVIMSRTLHKHFPAIKLCAEENKQNKRKKMIDACCDDNFTKAVSECYWNVTYGRVPLSTHKIQQLKRHKALLRKLSVEKWLSKDLSYTLHKPVRKRFSRNKTIVFYIDELWQMDMCDTSSLKQFNDGETFIFSIIDVFRKIGFARSLKDKKDPTVLKAFLNVLEESGRKPTKVQTDSGVEFTNRAFKSTLKKHKIHFYVTFSENKAAVVERFNRMLKSQMWRYFTHNNTYRYRNWCLDIVHLHTRV